MNYGDLVIPFRNKLCDCGACTKLVGEVCRIGEIFTDDTVDVFGVYGEEWTNFNKKDLVPYTDLVALLYSEKEP